MKFKKLNEATFANFLESKFKDYNVWTEDGDRWWYFRHKLSPRFNFNVGPVDDDPKNIKDFSNLITLKDVTIDYSKKSYAKTSKELNEFIDNFAQQLKKAFTSKW